MSLIDLKQQEAEILNDVLANMEEDGGVITPEDDEKLAEIEAKIKNKLNAYIGVIKKGGLIDYQITTAKKNIEELKYFIERLERKKQWMTSMVHKHIEVPTEFVVDGALKWVKPDFKVTRAVDLNKVEEQYKHWAMNTVLAPNEKPAVEEVLKMGVFNGIIDPAFETKILEALSPKCNITSLPKGHEAVVEKTRVPTLKITVNRPKEDKNETEN